MKPETRITHLLIRVTHVPGQPTRYRARCGHDSSDKREFIDPTTSHALPDCPACSGVPTTPVEGCPERHLYYESFLTYRYCPYCGQELQRVELP